MKVARDHASLGNMESAMIIWSMAAYQLDYKHAGEAAFNMAVSCSLNGRADIAKEWAKISANKYYYRQAEEYLGFAYPLNYNKLLCLLPVGLINPG